METSLQHASSSFADSIIGDFNKLTSDQAFDVLGVKAWHVLQIRYNKVLAAQGGELTYPTSLSVAFNKLTRALLAAFHDAVLQAVNEEPPKSDQDTVLSNLALYVPQADIASGWPWTSFQRNQKILTATFWRCLSKFRLPDFQTVSIDNKTVRIPDLVTNFNLAWRDGARAGFLTNSTNINLVDAWELQNLVRSGELPFDIAQFRGEVFGRTLKFCQNRYDQAACESGGLDLPLPLSEHLLLNLRENDFRFLPLWAGGDDDGSGGVFQTVVPAAEMGPNGPGPVYHTGYTVASEVSGHEELNFETLSLGSTEKGLRSDAAKDSASTIISDHDVLSVSGSFESEAFTTADDGDFFAAAHHSRNRAFPDAADEIIRQAGYEVRDEVIEAAILQEQRHRDEALSRLGVLIDLGADSEPAQKITPTGKGAVSYSISADISVADSDPRSEAESAPASTTASDFSLI